MALPAPALCAALLGLSALLFLPQSAAAVNCFANNATLIVLARGDASLLLWPAEPFPSECVGGSLSDSQSGVITVQTTYGSERFSAYHQDISLPLRADAYSFEIEASKISAATYQLSLQLGSAVFDVTGPVSLIQRQLSNYSCWYGDGDSPMSMQIADGRTRFCLMESFDTWPANCQFLDSSSSDPLVHAEVFFTIPGSAEPYVHAVQESFPPGRECDGCFVGELVGMQPLLFCFDCEDSRCERTLNTFSSSVTPTATLVITATSFSGFDSSFPARLSRSAHSLSTSTYADSWLIYSSMMILYESKVTIIPPWPPQHVEELGLGSTLKGSVEVTMTLPAPPSRPDLAPLEISATWDSLPGSQFDIPCPDAACRAQVAEYLQKSYGNDWLVINYAKASLLIRIRDRYGAMVDRVTTTTPEVLRACFTRVYQYFQKESVGFTFTPLADPCDLQSSAPTVFVLQMYEIATVVEEADAGGDSGGEGDGEGGGGGGSDSGSEPGGDAGGSTGGDPGEGSGAGDTPPATQTTRRVERKIATFSRSIFAPPLDLNELVFTCDDYVLQTPEDLSEYDYDHDCSAALEHAKKLIVKGKGSYRSYITVTGTSVPPIEAMAWTNRDTDNMFLVLAACAVVVLFAGAVWAALSVRLFRRKQGAMNE